MLDFYNRYSLRYLIKSIKRPNAVSLKTTDHEVFTDTIAEHGSVLFAIKP